VRALVLAGGGARGAWEAGFLNHLMGVLGYSYDVLCGISVGALNAAFLAQFDVSKPPSISANELTAMWRKFGQRDVYKSWPWYTVLWGFLRGRRPQSVYDSRPLHATTRGVLDAALIANSGHKLCIGAVELSSGEYRAWRESMSDIVEGVLASSAVPALFCPVEVDGLLYVDGGVRNMTPLGAAISMGATHIDVLMTSPEGVAKESHDHWDALDIAKRILDIMLYEIAAGDLLIAQYINQMVESGNSAFRHVDINVYRPSEHLGVSLEFTPETIGRLIEMGERDARIQLVGEGKDAVA